MKLSSMLAFVMLSLVFARDLSAQISREKPLLPVQTNGSPLFGKDIVIHDKPDHDQRDVAVCSAFNGWLYAAYSYYTSGALWLSVWKSTDNGIHWDNLLDGPLSSGNCVFKNLNIAVCGNSETNLKIFFAGVVVSNNSEYGQGNVWRSNANTIEYEKTLIFEAGTYDLAFTNDFFYPAYNSNPYSIGVIYSKDEYFYGKYLFYASSEDGGETTIVKDTLGISEIPFFKVSLSYGRSHLCNTGRSFAVWEQPDNVNSPTGHIYTAHTEPNFNSPFTKPVCIDSLDPSAINLCRNPVIACQYSDTDNDSANLTTVILYEQYDPVNDRFDVKGVYNLQSTLTSCFKPLSFTNPAHENLQPDIAFNPYTSTFMATWYDATDQKLPFVTNSMNMQQPGNWTVVSTGFNDASNLEDPHPKVRLSFSEQKGINVWSSEGTGGNGVALFDAEYSPYTSVSEINRGEGAILSGAYPNPCDQYLNIAFELDKSEKVTIRLYDLSGQDLKLLCDQTYPSGKNTFKTLTADLSPGTYIYTFRAGEFSGYGKFSVLNH